MFRALLRRLLRPFATYHPYSAASDVGGFLGWYEVRGWVVAFKTASHTQYRW